MLSALLSLSLRPDAWSAGARGPSAAPCDAARLRRFELTSQRYAGPAAGTGWGADLRGRPRAPGPGPPRSGQQGTSASAQRSAARAEPRSGSQEPADCRPAPAPAPAALQRPARAAAAAVARPAAQLQQQPQAAGCASRVGQPAGTWTIFLPTLSAARPAERASDLLQAAGPAVLSLFAFQTAGKTAMLARLLRTVRIGGPFSLVRPRLCVRLGRWRGSAGRPSDAMRSCCWRSR